MTVAREPLNGVDGAIVELACLARGLEAGGIYNGAKVVRAILDRELTRAATTKRLDEAGRAAGVARIADALAADGDDPALVAALRAAATKSTLPLVDAPRTWTCRACGRIFLGSVPAWCPNCEAPAATAREQIPVWYLEPMTPTVALIELETGLDALMELVAGRPDEVLAAAPRPGEWSVRETLLHLVAAEELLATRVPRLLDEDDPELVAAAAWVLPPSDEETVASDLPAAELVERIRRLRSATVARLRVVDDRGWERTGRHPEWGSVTVTAQAAYFARHLWSHLAQVRSTTLTEHA